MGQPRLELDGAIQLFEGQVQLAQPPVGLGQVDIGLVRVRLPFDRRFQVGDGVVESLLPDAQDAAIDEEHIAGIVIERQSARPSGSRHPPRPTPAAPPGRSPAADRARRNRTAGPDRR